MFRLFLCTHSQDFEYFAFQRVHGSLELKRLAFYKHTASIKPWLMEIDQFMAILRHRSSCPSFIHCCWIMSSFFIIIINLILFYFVFSVDVVHIIVCVPFVIAIVWYLLYLAIHYSEQDSLSKRYYWSYQQTTNAPSQSKHSFGNATATTWF